MKKETKLQELERRIKFLEDKIIVPQYSYHLPDLSQCPLCGQWYRINAIPHQCNFSILCDNKTDGNAH